MKEPDVKKRAVQYLEKKKHCEVKKKSSGDPREFQWKLNGFTKRKKQRLDVVGISEKGEIWIVECKAGVINRPLQGAGQLIRYRTVIEKYFELFKEELKNWTKKMERRSLIDELRPQNLWYCLALAKNREKKWNEVLGKCLKYLGFKKECEYCDILVFKHEKRTS